MHKHLAALALTTLSTLALAEATVFPLPTATGSRPATTATAPAGTQALVQGEATVFVDRATSTLTRAQVRAETLAHFAMHRPHGEASHQHIDPAQGGSAVDRAMVMADAADAARTRPIGEANRSDINQRAR